MYDLDDSEFAALRAAAAELQEDVAYLSITEGGETEMRRSPLHWRVSLLASPYEQLHPLGWPHICENAIYSTESRWALKISSSGLAVAAGPRRFVDKLTSSLEHFSLQRVRLLIREWPSKEPHWLLPCLIQVFGTKVASELLSST
jgi:hypothetical protein